MFQLQFYIWFNDMSRINLFQNILNIVSTRALLCTKIVEL